MTHCDSFALVTGLSRHANNFVGAKQSAAMQGEELGGPYTVVANGYGQFSQSGCDTVQMLVVSLRGYILALLRLIYADGILT